MSKRTKALDKECNEWRSKYEKSNRAILDMASDKQTQDLYVAKAARQLAQLQKLCRTLQVTFLVIFAIYWSFILSQAERNVLLDVLKANNIERPEMPELPAEPTDIEPPPRNADKLDLMSRNCSELKKSLAQLQSQMNTLAAEKEKPTTVAPKKANKNKKNKAANKTPVMDSKDRAIHKEMVATIKSVFAPNDGGNVPAAAAAAVTEIENGDGNKNGGEIVVGELAASLEVINLESDDATNTNGDTESFESFECIDEIPTTSNSAVATE